ncbi:Membrane-bound lytic murein transglycosylase D precursor [Thermodesulfovibrio sp. N1]|uniref:C40 family peptidase n=1 Tax=unclassified Thermodesulfovibrio TaxID=2645936 RepID=UPI00083AB6DC|nr:MULTISPECIES: C40 family peptidase [unclassified Thermodesulfovibrio]MDI1472600.1 LysM peptidoglycan-binding domain-containing protein [Thermodesulfovibrio sp. 1176]ODA44395.1 Membrane-bound lytic murein transglycosylase D precursor [Thermodesulfovibrio sp. N1]
MSKIFIFIIASIIFPCLVFAQTYTVKKGDNIYRISKKFNVTVEDIKEANNLTTDKLQIGMKLEIPEKNSKITKKSKELKNSTEPQYHIVKKGENLYRIAKKYNISVDELKRLNDLNSNKLNIGQKLLVKAPVKPKENLSIRENEKVPALSNAKLDIEEKKEEIEEIKASEDLSQMSITERLLLFAKKMLHLPYRFGGNSFSGLDCSFFVKKVYSMVGIDLPRSAREQFTVGVPVKKEELQPGDLVFFRTYAKFPSHVGIYLGDNLFIHASTRSKKVTIDSLEAPYYLSRYIGAKRILGINRESIEKAIEEIKNQEG